MVVRRANHYTKQAGISPYNLRIYLSSSLSSMYLSIYLIFEIKFTNYAGIITGSNTFRLYLYLCIGHERLFAFTSAIQEVPGSIPGYILQIFLEV